MGWQEHASCRDTVPDLFFPASDDFTGPEAARQLLVAAAVCGRCPVRRECLTYAVESGQAHGIWAGHTPANLRAIRRQRAVGVPDPMVDADPMCPGCSLLFALPAIDGQLCPACAERQEKGA